jgi:hypothetical protein
VTAATQRRDAELIERIGYRLAARDARCAQLVNDRGKVGGSSIGTCNARFAAGTLDGWIETTGASTIRVRHK